MSTLMQGGPAKVAKQAEVVLAAALTNSLNTTPAIDISSAGGGSIFIPTGSSINSLTFYISTAVDGTFIALYDGANAAVVKTVAAARGYPLPAECFGALAVKIVANAAGSVDISLKG